MRVPYQSPTMKYHFQVILACLLAAVMFLAPASAYASTRSAKPARSGVSHHQTRTYHNRTPKAHVRHARTHRG